MYPLLVNSFCNLVCVLAALCVSCPDTPENLSILPATLSKFPFDNEFFKSAARVLPKP